MKYFLTGATGFLGGHLAEKFLQEGHTVVGAYRTEASLQPLPAWQKLVVWRKVDLLDPLSLEEAMQDCDAVIHCAGMVSFRRKDLDKLLQVNGEATANVVNTCLYLGAKPLCYISSVAAVGIPPDRDGGGQPVGESAKWHPENENSVYAISKKKGEQEVWRGIEEGLPAVIVNPSVILGTGDWSRSSLQLLQAAAHPPLRYPPGRLNYVDVRDVSEAVYRLVTEGAWGERFIASAGSVPYREFFAQVAERLGKQPPAKPLKRWQALALVQVAKLLSPFNPQLAKLNKEFLKNAFSTHTYSGQKLSERLQVPYRSFGETLDWCCEALKGQQ